MSNLCALKPPGINQTKHKNKDEKIRIAEITARQLKQAIKPLEKVSKVVVDDKEPIIEISVFWKTLALTATNKQHCFSTHIDLDHECSEEIAFTLPTEVLVKVAKSLKNQDRLIIEKRSKKIDFINGVNFTAQISKVPLLEVEEFKQNEHYASCKSRGWKTAFITALIAATEEKSRYALDVVRIVSQLNKLKLITTDGRRMSMANLKDIQERDRFFEVSLQKSVAELLVPLLDDDTEVSLNVGDKSISVQFWNKEKDVWYCSESILGKDHFPNWRNIIPEPQQRAVFSKKEVETALTKMSKLACNLQNKSDWYFFEDGGLVLKIENEEDKQESHVVLRSKEGFIQGTYHYNYNYVLDYLKVLDEEDLVFEQSGKPCVLSGSSGNTQYILMQIINENDETKPVVTENESSPEEEINPAASTTEEASNQQ